MRVCERERQRAREVGWGQTEIQRQEDIPSWHSYITSSLTVPNLAEDIATGGRRGREGCVNSLLRDCVIGRRSRGMTCKS